MANVYPSIEEIKRIKVKPTDGEWELLTFLTEQLDNSYHIFFQPYLNGDQPDIVLYKEYVGMFIFEVKDWNLESYFINQGKWTLKRNGSKLVSPLQQVKKYKDNLIELHIENLYEKLLNNNCYYSIINLGVYFHNATEEEAKSFVQKDKSYQKYIDILGYDSLAPESLSTILEKRHMKKESNLIDKEINNIIMRYLKPSFHVMEIGKQIFYNDKQRGLTVSKSTQQKIKGVAGSGKTAVLAKRAVNAVKRTKSNVLVLTFNISLINYIHDKINDVRDSFHWKNFHINYYHGFIKSQCINLQIEMTSFGDYENENLFEEKKNELHRYDAIFIDEVQDYMVEWQRVIKKYFLAEGGELVLFGDEKQNIYGRELEEKKIKTIIPGAWNTLNESYRFSNKITELSMAFQDEFLINKYEKDVFAVQTKLNLSDQYEDRIRYYYVNNESLVLNDIYKHIKENAIHSNDICFLAANKELLRQTDFYIRTKVKERTSTTFESKEMYEKLKQELPSEDFKKKIYNLERSKKRGFWMNPGNTKLSTIYSFKGWESHTIVLLIEKNIKDVDTNILEEELIYTGLTRCRGNVIIVNLGDERFHQFFKNHESLYDYYKTYEG